MSKIALILGDFSIGTRPLDFWFNNINISTRGLTGTEISFIRISKEFKKMGHEVHLFTVNVQPYNKPDMYEGMKLYNIDERFSVINDTFDVLVSIHEPDVFRGLTSKPLRVVYQMLNDFTYCQVGFDEYVDQWVAVCDEHKNHLLTQPHCPADKKFQIVPLGCDPELYSDNRVYGRMIWCSSADRGLHNLLEIFPYIKSRVPEANLKIFYHFNYGQNLFDLDPNDTSINKSIVELGHRVRYMKNAIQKLDGFGVEHVGSISRDEMVKEMSEASVFAFPCDTVAKTEGFSVSTLEAHASYTVPVITDQDCLGSIYRNSGCVMHNSPVRKELKKYADSVIKALTDKSFADDVISKCRAFAKEHTWANTAAKLNEIIINHPKFQANK
jgi:glycosyltransferase involved in cell wall biosynthesis